MPHRYEIQVRQADMDAFNHVNNVVYATYFDEARRDMLRGLAGHADVTERVVVAKHRLSYLRPLVHRPAPVYVDSAITGVGTSSFTVEHAIRDEDTVYCTAESVLVTFDRNAKAPRAISEAERSVLEGLR